MSKTKPAPETIAAVKIGEEMTASQFSAPYQSTTAITGEDAVVFTRPQLIAVLAVAAEQGEAQCMTRLRATRGRKAHPLCIAPRPCTCDTCTIRIALTHAAGDAASGREWTCQCGACKRISKLPEFTRRNLERERAIRRADASRPDQP